MYNYQTQKKNLFTDDGQRMFLKIRDRVVSLLKQAGAVRLEEATRGITGNSWDMLACVDRLVELEEVREILQADIAQQHRIFVSVQL